MQKKKIYISLLFIAYFLLLAHSVIPHDHFKGLVFLFLSEEDIGENVGAFSGIARPFHDCSFFCSLDDPGYISRNQPDMNVGDNCICGKLAYQLTPKSFKEHSLSNIGSGHIIFSIKSHGLRGPPLS